MTLKEFQETTWYPSDKVIYNGKEYDVLGVDFSLAKIRIGIKASYVMQWVSLKDLEYVIQF
jgi:hypothetical protein